MKYWRTPKFNLSSFKDKMFKFEVFQSLASRIPNAARLIASLYEIHQTILVQHIIRAWRGKDTQKILTSSSDRNRDHQGTVIIVGLRPWSPTFLPKPLFVAVLRLSTSIF